MTRRRLGSMISVLAVLAGTTLAYGSNQDAQPSRAIFSANQAQRGATLFAEHCAPCHGVNLTGTDFGPGLSGADLTARWRNRSVGDLFTLIQTTMPLNSPGGLSAQQNADIVAFLLQRAGFPAGGSELRGEPTALALMKFAALSKR